MFRFLWRVSREALALHLVLPMFASLAVGTGLAYWNGKITDRTTFFQYWGGEHVTELLTVYLVFVTVLVYLANRHAETRITNLGILDDILPGSKAYFALGAIPLAEWFQPSVQVYFTTLLKQGRSAGFVHHRVLLFLTPGSFMDAHSSVLDGYYARCLVRMHKDSGAVLGYLAPETLYEALDGLQPKERSFFGYWKRWTIKSWWWPLHSWNRRRLTERLAFAELTRADGSSCIVKFLKRPNELSVRTLTEAKDVAPYQSLLTIIKAKVYHTGTVSLRAEHDFAKHIEV